MTTTQTSKLIQELELEDRINDYKVEHRQKMYHILNLFKNYKPYRLTCGICNITKIGIVLSSESLEEFICSKRCFLFFFKKEYLIT